MNKSIRPPFLADTLFAWYCKNASIEDLHGDMEEIFYSNLRHMPAAKAKYIYWKHCLSLMFSYAIKKRKKQASPHPYSSSKLNLSMFKNYFLIAGRNLAKHRFFTVINIFALAFGMSISLLFLSMLSFIMQYDNFHTHKEEIYRVVTYVDDLQLSGGFASSPASLANKLKRELTGIKEVVRVNSTLSAEAEYGQKKIQMGGYFVDANFLDVFTFPLLRGNATHALTKPYSLLITEKTALKMFGEEDPLGKIINMGEWGQFEITGIMKDHPINSHMHFEILASYATLETAAYQLKQTTQEDWKEFRNHYTYLLLPEGNGTDKIYNFLNQTAETVYNQEENYKASFELQALNDITPGTSLYNQIGPDWDLSSMSIFFVLTLLVLLPACFNYTNLSISRALKRMKEIGIRKVMGGTKSQIFAQFMMETVLLSFIALFFSFYIFSIIKTEFLNMLASPDGLSLDITPLTILYFVGFTLFVGLLAGLAPALYFAKLNPVEALKKIPTGKNKLGFGKVLMVSQFALSLGFIMAVVISFSQYKQTMNYNFGFEQANILDVELRNVQAEILSNEFSKISEIQSISMSSHIMGTQSSEPLFIRSLSGIDSVEVYQMSIDQHYLDNLQIPLLIGQNFGDQASINQQSVIVNEAFLKAWGITEPASALNQTFLLPNNQPVTVIAVSKNFHYTHLKEPIKSFIFRYDPSQFQYANLKIQSDDIYASLGKLDAAWKTFAPQDPFTAKFFNDEIEDAYVSYFSIIKICGFMGLMAICISCLGLLGMVVFNVENRVKEVGLRKVLGASSANVVVLLSKDFLMLMLVASAIAVPLTYLLFDQLILRIEHSRIPIGPLEIIISLVLMLLLGLSTVFSQTIKAARANPVDSLKHE